MNRYEIDEHEFHNLLKDVRRKSGAPMWQVALGICSVSAISRMESGERVQEKLMRDRVLGRLGVSQEYFEEYLRVEEYAQWQQRMLLLDCIREGDIVQAGDALDKLIEISEKNVVQLQFADAMNYMILQLQGAPKSLLCAQVYLAIIRTIPSYEMAFMGTQLLDVQELNLILELFHNLEYKGAEEGKWRLENYLQVLRYIEKSSIDDFGKAKLYPRIANYVGEIMIENKMEKVDLELAYKLCSKALSLLHKIGRTYCYVEVLEKRIFIGNRLLAKGASAEQKEILAKNKAKDTRRLEKVKAEYTKNGMQPYTKDFTFIYEEAECKSAVEVVRQRMEALHITSQKMEKTACSSRTLLRMKNKNESITLNSMKPLFKRIGLYPDFKNAQIISGSMQQVERFYQLKILMEHEKWEKAAKCLMQLREELDMTIPQNEQILDYVERLLEWKALLGEPQTEAEDFVYLLECTMSLDALDAREQHFTKTEWYCILQLAIGAEGSMREKSLALLEDFCRQLLGNRLDGVMLHNYNKLICYMIQYYMESGQKNAGEEMRSAYEKACLKYKKFISYTKQYLQ